jgi:hypothetical protein
MKAPPKLARSARLRYIAVFSGVVKPTIEAGFDPRGVPWNLAADEETPPLSGRATRVRHADAANSAAHGHDQNPSHHIDQFPVVNT